MQFKELPLLFPDAFAIHIIEPKRTIHSVHVLSKDSELKTDTLYIGYISVFISCRKAYKRGNYILIQDIPLPSMDDDNNFFLLPNTDDIYAISRKVAQNLQGGPSESPTEASLMKLFLETNDLKQLCEQCAAYLHNPILITDSGYNIMAYSNHQNMLDDIWHTGWKRGYLTFEFIAYLKGEASNYFESNPQLNATIAETISEHRRKIHKLTMNGMFLGYLIVLEYDTAFSQHNDQEELVVSLLAKQMSINKIALTHSYRKKELNLFADLLNQRILNRRMFQERVSGTLFEENDTYQIYTINLCHLPSEHSPVQDQLRNELKNLLKNLYMLPYERELVILSCFKQSEHEENLKTLENFLNKHQLQAGCSDVFTDLYRLYDFYKQSTHALEFQKYDDKDNSLFHYDKIRFFHLLSTLETTDLTQFCDPLILRLAQDDQKNKTDYFKTLYLYLKYRGSIQKTAQKCFVHRNTINYRISKIKEVYGIDAEADTHYFNYYVSCIIVFYMINEQTQTPII